MRLRLWLALVFPIALIACGQRDRPASAPEASATVTVDPSGDARPQPNPNGGDTPLGATGPAGASPEAYEAARPGDPAAPATISPPNGPQ